MGGGSRPPLHLVRSNKKLANPNSPLVSKTQQFLNHFSPLCSSQILAAINRGVLTPDPPCQTMKNLGTPLSHCRTAPATPGLLKSTVKTCHTQEKLGKSFILGFFNTEYLLPTFGKTETG